MKYPPNRNRHSGKANAHRVRPLHNGTAILGSIPGLERLLPGHYRPGSTARTRYGTWILPRRFRGRPLCAIVDGVMIGRGNAATVDAHQAHRSPPSSASISSPSR